MTEKLQKLHYSKVKKNTEVLESLYLSSSVDIDRLEGQYGLAQDQSLDVAIATLARYGKEALLHEIIEAEEIDPKRSSYDKYVLAIMTALHALWIDVDFFINHEDNLLNHSAMSTASTDEGRTDRYERATADIVAQRGKLMRFDESFYGWEEYEESNRPEIVAAFDLKTDYWSEFNGTFNTASDSHHGFSLHVLYADGIFRKLRYETDLGEMMRALR